MRTRTRLIALAACLSIAALAQTSLASASAPSGGGGTGGSVGAGGGGAPSSGGGGGAHVSGGGAALGGGFRGDSFAGGGLRGGVGSPGGGMAGSRSGGVGFATHGFYAPARGYGMVGSQSAGLGRMVAMRGGPAAEDFAAIGPRFASAAEAVRIARVPRVTLRIPAVRPGPRPPPTQRPVPKMQKLSLPSRAGSCEFDSCRQVFFQPFCIDLTAQELKDPHFVRGPFDCPEPVRDRMR